ncbi:hypothetical protein LINPERHAP2_LOCUS24092, partial [Linum perenne]
MDSLNTISRKNRPDVLFLSDTKNLSSVIGRKHCSLSSGLAFAWLESVVVVVRDRAHFFIVVDVTLPRNFIVVDVTLPRNFIVVDVILPRNLKVTIVGVHLSCNVHQHNLQFNFFIIC